MGLLNVNLGILSYVDGPATTQPRLRQADLQWSLMGIPADNFKNIPVSLAPGETQTITSTARTLTYTGSTSFVVTDQGSGVMRIAASIGQRASRNAGDGTTVWDITISGTAVKMQAVSGTMPGFAGMSVGDLVDISTGFNPLNQGEFIILSKGADYIEFINPIAQAEAGISGTVSIYSSGPVQKGDIIDITDAAFAFPNQGSFSVLKATDQYIEVLNPNVFPQTVTGVAAGGVKIYPFAFKWMVVVIDRKVQVGLNGEAPGATEVEPPVEGDLIKNPGLFLKRGKVFEVQLKNPGQTRAEGFLILAE